ncbi:peptidoglycan DD-metalloendopeptidase family protein [Bacillus infantis]|uniref:aggregation-promoting factor C-terminal-like domain-containing protein n=1 Tax=Bacillus infantis TaxID=324767 RepID=UPI003CE8307A
MDIAMPKGAPVPATVGGTVVFAEFGQKGSGYGGYGNTVAIRDAKGNIHRYAHLDSIKVKVGEKVPPGAIVGGAGSTGKSTGNHLDYGVTNAKGQSINPEGYLKGSGGQAQASGGSTYKNTFKTTYEALKTPSYQTYKQHLAAALQTGKIPGSWVVGLTELIGRESSWNPSAKNPKSTAHGYGQFLKQTRADYEKKTGLSYSDPVAQILMTAQYVKDRYGSPEKALLFWDKNRYY